VRVLVYLARDLNGLIISSLNNIQRVAKFYQKFSEIREHTPFAVLSLDKLKYNMEFFSKLRGLFKTAKFYLIYALKANYMPALLTSVLRNPLVDGVEVSSLDELYRIFDIALGTNKNLKLVISMHALRPSEASSFIRAAKRISPEIVASIYDECIISFFLSPTDSGDIPHKILRLSPYGQQKAKFGFSTRVKNMMDLPIVVNGVHEHSLTLYKPTIHFEDLKAKLLYIRDSVLRLNALRKIADEQLIIDIGGGIAPPIFLEHTDLEVFADLIHEFLLESLKSVGSGETHIFLEPGRGLVGDATAIYTELLAVRNGLLIFDISTNVLVPFPTAMYVVLQEGCVDVDTTEWKVFWSSINPNAKNPSLLATGRLCSTSDIIRGVIILYKKPRPGERFFILNVGAYAPIMSSDFIYKKPDTFIV